MVFSQKLAKLVQLLSTEQLMEEQITVSTQVSFVGI